MYLAFLALILLLSLIFQMLSYPGLELVEQFTLSASNAAVLLFLGILASRSQSFWESRSSKYFRLIYTLPIIIILSLMLGFRLEWSLSPMVSHQWFYVLASLSVLILITPTVFSVSEVVSRHKSIGRVLGVLIIGLALVPYFKEQGLDTEKTKVFSSAEPSMALNKCNIANEKDRSMPLFFPIYFWFSGASGYCIQSTGQPEELKNLAFRPSITVATPNLASLPAGFSPLILPK